jgi:NitT/TauT family transport system ATP-binding protein
MAFLLKRREERDEPQERRREGGGGPSGAEEQALVQVDEVARRFGAVQALDRVSLRVQAGEFVSVVGPSGCGKSTLLEILGGLLTPDAGEVVVAGEHVQGPRDSTAIVFQEVSTLPWRSVLDNVAFALEVKKSPRRQRREKAQELIDLVGLSGFERHYPGQLSGGMRQRVAIARSLTLEPDLILADEPFGALDEQTRLMLSLELLRIVDRLGCGVLLITHSIQEAILLSDRVLVMSARPGRILDEVDVGLPRPRSTEALGAAHVAALTERIWGHLQSEASRGMALEEKG